jgi:hypothetical protein
LEVADVFRRHGQEFLDRWGNILSRQQLKAFRDIVACRTAALGTHVRQCDRCAHQLTEYRSCRNRHCPKCHSRERDRWLQARASEILPVPYAHVIFTLPHQAAPLALQNPKVVYGILFRAVSEALCEMAADPKRLGVRIGFMAILHTWNQRLDHHPHIHCVVPAGGLSHNGQRWRAPKNIRFFLPVKPLGRLFRNKFLCYLQEAFAAGQLAFYGQLRELAHPARFHALVSALAHIDWVAYAKRPFGGPDQVLRYLARYTHRVAIANGRLLALEDGCVRFRWRDSRDDNRMKEMSLEGVEFIRRFLMHVLPSGFVKIRYYGFLSNRSRKRMVEHCRQLLPRADQPTLQPMVKEYLCPVCKIGHMRLVSAVDAPPAIIVAAQPLVRLDSS